MMTIILMMAADDDRTVILMMAADDDRYPYDGSRREP
jgi:hypothetical protein